MNIMIVDASRGLRRALVDGLLGDGHAVIGVSRQQAVDLPAGPDTRLQWIAADLAAPPPKRLSTSRIVRMLLSLSNASFVRELVMPALRDERF